MTLSTLQNPDYLFFTQGRIQGVCLAVMTPPFVLQAGYSALKQIIKYQMLSLQVSNAVVWKRQRPTFPF